MKVQTFLLLITLYHLSPTSKSAPVEESNRDLPVDREPEDRRIRRRRPCRGRSDAEGDGRTFFDWNYSYVNVNHNYIYNCGGNGGGGGHRPLGGGHRPLGGHNQGGGHPGGGIFGSHGGGGGNHGGGGGIHNGGGGGGIHGGNGENHGSGGGNYGGGGNSGGGGLFGLGLFNWLHNNRPSTPKPIEQYEPEEPEKPQEPEKPDYTVDKPVNEDYDDVLPEGYQNWKPGQYVTAYNPIFGSYVQDLTNFNPNKIIKQVNREVNKFFRPLYHLFRR